MPNNNRLTAIEVNTQEQCDKSVIWLHGLGADGNDFAPIVQELRLPNTIHARFIFPHAPVMPVTVNQGYEMPAWFDIHNTDIGARVDTPGIQRSVSQINALIEHEITRGVAAANILLAGFSQGAVIALTTGLLYSERLAGIIALSGLLPNSKTLIQQASAANRDLPIFLAHGTQDLVVPMSLGRDAYEALASASYPVTWHPYAMAHSVCHQEIIDISHWIQKIWK